MPILNRIADFSDDMKAWRRHLHQRPELLLDTVNTAAFVTEKLREFGVDEIHTGIAQNGVVALISGKVPGPTIGLRADMDALPIHEARDIAWKSQTHGKMHACGHDGHTTMLLGAARYLAETRNFAGRVALIFQPGEDGAGGGRIMVEEGIMERFAITQVYALHNWPNLTMGTFGMTAGPCMAATDVFDIVITGKGAHAAYPHLSVDPVNVAVQMAQAIGSIVSRQLDPLDTAVVSLTNIHAGSIHNVIPAQAILSGTVRTLRHEAMLDIRTKLQRIVDHLPASFGASAVMEYQIGYPVTVNDDDAVDFAAKVATDIAGAAHVQTDRRPEMGAEDFSFMLQKRPGAYVLLGQGESAGLHHPDYDFNDDIAPIGASYFARLVEMAQPL
jgi:hippurate hydrolase